MKMSMRFHASQLTNFYKFTTVGYYTIPRDIWIEAGYTYVDFLVVGGGGGAAGDSGSNSRVAECGAGGGGGGMLTGRVTLAALGEFTAGVVGGPGANGAKGSDGVPGGNGGVGGTSQFGGYLAYGGGGGIGGTVYMAGGHVSQDQVDPSVGGDGGGNSVGLGAGGVGGRNAHYIGWPTQFHQNAVAPTPGSIAASGVFTGGLGGGGGYGMFRWLSATDTNAGSGANGNMVEFGSSGGGPIGFTGGKGGGANISAFSGISEAYGDAGASGVLALRFG